MFQLYSHLRHYFMACYSYFMLKLISVKVRNVATLYWKLVVINHFNILTHVFRRVDSRNNVNIWQYISLSLHNVQYVKSSLLNKNNGSVKVKLSLCLKHHAMKTYGGVEL
jgi:hypothetical protein